MGLRYVAYANETQLLSMELYDEDKMRANDGSSVTLYGTCYINPSYFKTLTYGTKSDCKTGVSFQLSNWDTCTQSYNTVYASCTATYYILTLPGGSRSLYIGF